MYTKYIPLWLNMGKMKWFQRTFKSVGFFFTKHNSTHDCDYEPNNYVAIRIGTTSLGN